MRMPLNDRFVRGFLAGLIRSIPMNIISYISYYFVYAKLRFVDWAVIMIFGKEGVGLDEYILAQLAQIFFAVIIGVAFAYFIPYVSSKALYLKGSSYRVTC